MKNGNGNTRWAKVTAIVALGTFCLSIVGALGTIMWWLFSLSSDLRYQTTRNTEFDTRITENNNGIRALQLTVRAQERDLNEIETQFCGNDIIRNKTQAEVQRILAMLWSKTYGTAYPTDNAYYPTICNRQSNK